VICPRCRKSMVQNAYADPGQYQCNTCGLVLTVNDDWEIVSTNETCGKAYILRGATGRATRGHTNCRYSFTPRSNHRLPKTTRSVLREAITGRT
jgi:hypothetical protein